MHERTQRAVARLLFVFTCALPTLLTCWLVLLTWTPWYGDYRRRALQHELSQRLGVSVSIESIEYPAPSVMRLLGVVLLDPESQDEISRIRAVEWAYGKEQSVLHFSQPELRSAHLPAVWQVVHDRFLSQPELTAAPLRMSANDLTIRSETGPLTMERVDALIRPEEHRIVGLVHCQPAAQSEQKPVILEVARDRSGRAASTQWVLSSGETSLPCSPLAECLPWVRNLGPQATFTGRLRWTTSRDSWSLDLSGSRLERVDLAELTYSVPHRLTGLAGVQFSRGRILPGESVDLSGTLVAAQGVVGQSLLHATRNELQFVIADGFANQQGDIAYERLAVRFDWFGPQLSIAGISGELRGYEFLDSGVVLTTGGLPVISSPGQPRSWASLVRAFWGDGRETLPVSDQSAWLLGVLPAPSRTDVAMSPDDATGTGVIPRHRITGTVTPAGSMPIIGGERVAQQPVIAQPE